MKLSFRLLTSEQKKSPFSQNPLPEGMQSISPPKFSRSLLFLAQHLESVCCGNIHFRCAELLKWACKCWHDGHQKSRGQLVLLRAAWSDFHQVGCSLLSCPDWCKRTSASLWFQTLTSFHHAIHDKFHRICWNSSLLASEQSLDGPLEVQCISKSSHVKHFWSKGKLMSLQKETQLTFYRKDRLHIHNV